MKGSRTSDGVGAPLLGRKGSYGRRLGTGLASGSVEGVEGEGETFEAGQAGEGAAGLVDGGDGDGTAVGAAFVADVAQPGEDAAHLVHAAHLWQIAEADDVGGDADRAGDGPSREVDAHRQTPLEQDHVGVGDID